MRRIIKGQEPEDLRTWKEENAQVPQNLTYTNMPKAGVKRQMLAEQGGLCAYTMLWIPTPDDCHIEHVVPRSQDRTLEISYHNLVACIPGNVLGHRAHRGKYPYGAEKKDQTRICARNFVSPLQENVEEQFHFDADGSVAHVGQDPGAESTIRILQLNQEQLVDLRKAAIEERVLDVEEPLSIQQALELSRSIMTPHADGRISEFCLAISHVATWYANRPAL